MPRKKKYSKSNCRKTPEMLNLPTDERLRHGGITVRSNRAQAEDPLRIDKMLKNVIIDEMQHLYGIQIITLWNIASRPFLKSMKYEPRTLMRLPDFDHINISRMSAEDQFYKTMSLMRPRDHELICRICFKEQAAIAAGREMGLPVNGITSYVRAAFDALGNALSQMRDQKRALEKPVEKKAELQD